jgi:hypothetical protein
MLLFLTGVKKIGLMRILILTVALTEFASSSLHTKFHLKKNPEVEKLDGKWSVIKSPITYRRVFLVAVFFRGELLYENSRYLPPPYSFAGGGYRSRHLWGLAGVRFLFYLNLYENIYIFTFKKNILRKTPCQIWEWICNPKQILV